VSSENGVAVSGVKRLVSPRKERTSSQPWAAAVGSTSKSALRSADLKTLKVCVRVSPASDQQGRAWLLEGFGLVVVAGQGVVAPVEVEEPFSRPS
jgi:hypothetical protein